MKRSVAALLALLLLLTAGCGRGEKEAGEGEWSLYFLADPGGGWGPALEAQAWDAQGDPDPGDLMEALLAGPEREGLASPFPRGVALQRWEWDEENEGNVKVVLSEQYSGLTDVSLTLADYAIVLTLSQLPEVESVEVQSTGYSANYRSHQMLAAEEAVLWDELAGEEPEDDRS